MNQIGVPGKEVSSAQGQKTVVICEQEREDNYQDYRIFI
jgi:hypothetical protein